MLLEFRVENHRSILGEQVLTAKAAPRLGGPDDDRTRNLAGVEGKYLPVLALYGANASGKTNVLDALLFMQEAVINSHRVWEPDMGVPRRRFKWSGESTNSTFEVEFVVDGTQFRYGFVVDSTRVVEEWLFSTLGGKDNLWFEREEDEIRFGEPLKSSSESVEAITGKNSLVLSAASQSRIGVVIPIYSWFRSISALNIRRRYRRSPFFSPRHRHMASLISTPDAELDPRDRNLIERFRKMLNISDFGVVDFKMNKDLSEGETFPRTTFSLKHSIDSTDPWLPLEEESQGTRTMFNISLQILQAIDSGSPLLFDELESSLHPLLAIEIVKLFNSRERNPKNSQLIFTTHDSNLLGTTLGDPVLRRDQVYLTEKDNSTGASCIYPLTDFKPRKSENLERGYLQGRYGAVPFLGGFDLFNGDQHE